METETIIIISHQTEPSQKLLFEQKELPLTEQEDRELSLYEELNDYLSLANRIMRNIIVRN